MRQCAVPQPKIIHPLVGENISQLKILCDFFPPPNETILS